MGWPSLLVFVRHGESLGNTLNATDRANLDLASHAYPLSKRGEEQARITGEYIRTTYGKFDACFSSYYTRATQTLKAIYPNVIFHEDARLAESQRGIYHTLTHDYIKERFPEEIARKEREGLYHYRPWGGENWADVELRIYSFINTLQNNYTKKRVLISGHGNWHSLFDRIIEPYSIEEAIERYKSDQVVENASVSVYRYDDYRESFKKTDYIIPWKE